MSAKKLGMGEFPYSRAGGRPLSSLCLYGNGSVLEYELQIRQCTEMREDGKWNKKTDKTEHENNTGRETWSKTET